MRFRRTLTVLVTCLVTVAGLTTALADAVPQGTVTRLPETFPNYWWDQGHNQDPNINNLSAFADPQKHRVFEFNGYFCPALAVYDSVSSKLLSTSKCDPNISFGNNVNSKAAVVAVDPVDGLLFFPNLNQGQQQPIYMYSEDLSREITLPSPSNENTIHNGGISWYAPADEILVERDFGGNGVLDPPAGVIIDDFSVAALLKGRFQPRFSYTVPGCSAGLDPFFATANPYRSADGRYIYVPCQLNGSSGLVINGVDNGVADGVVRVEMGSRDAAGASCPAGCPDGTTVPSMAPGVATDFLYDVASDRGFMPNNSTGGSSPGVSLLVYDGPHASFLGRARVGGPDDAAGLAFGQDELTGRIYAVGRDGLTVIDGRRTPVAPGVEFQQYAGATNYVTLPVIPADSIHQFTRLPVDYQYPAKQICADCTLVHDFTVFADTLPARTDPPASAIDSHTHQGPIPPGSSVTTIYGGTARGYGYHSDLVGGPQAVVDNVSPQSVGGNLPFAKGSRDLLGAQVRGLTLRDGAGDGAATALGDGNGSTDAAFGNCTDPASLNACSPLAPAPPAPIRTTQAWPYPEAQCSRPGSDAQLRVERGGLYVTTSYGADGSPVQTAIPGTGSLADASADCAATSPPNGVKATASLGAATLAASSGGPAIGIATATVTGVVTPPQGPNGVVSTATASVRGVHIDLGSAGAIDIGNITQTAVTTAAGVPGSAHGTYTVILGDITMTSGGTTTVLCGGTCTGSLESVAAQLDKAFPTLLHVSLPVPDDSFLSGCVLDQQSMKCNGSPGGYTTAVQASLVEQYSDRQFNGMSPEESSYLPALRIVVFGPNDGVPNISRQIIDFAGVDVDSEQGLDVLAPAVADTIQLPLTSVPLPALFLPPPTTAPPARHPQPGLGTQQQVISVIAPSSVVERTLDGLNWMARSPGDALEMAAFLGLLLLPFLLMDRRRLAIRDILGGRR